MHLKPMLFLQYFMQQKKWPVHVLHGQTILFSKYLPFHLYGFSKISADFLPLFQKALHVICRVCRAGGWKYLYFHTSLGQAVTVVKFFSRFPIGKNCFYLAVLQYPVQIAGHHIFDAAVAGTNNVTAGNNIPYGDSMRKEQMLLFFYGCRNRSIHQGCNHFPETILGVTVIKIHLP